MLKRKKQSQVLTALWGGLLMTSAFAPIGVSELSIGGPLTTGIQREPAAAPGLLIPSRIRFDEEALEAALADPGQLLNEQLQLIAAIRPHVERFDHPRLDMIYAGAEQVLVAIREYPMGHKVISDVFLDYFIRFEFSEAFFTSLGAETSWIHPRRQKLFEIAALLKQTYGYDKTPYAQILHSVLSQMQRLVDQLIQQRLPEPLDRALRAQVVPLGFAIGKAGGTGDRPKTFAAAKPIHDAILSLYPQFYELSASETLFKPMLELQALNEFLGKYGQFEN